MEERKTIFHYAGQVFLIFGFSMAAQSVFCLLFGEDAKEFSSMFALGGEGMSLALIWQFLLISVLIVFWRFLFFTDVVIKNLSTGGRAGGMVTAVLLTAVVFILLFDWFPADMWQPWVMFLLCFGICFAVSAAIVGRLEKTENRKMEEALRRAKQKEQEDGGNPSDDGRG